MLSGIAIVLLVFAAVFFLTLNLLRSLWKALRITLFIMFILGVFVGYLTIEDAKEFSDTLSENKTTYLLLEDSDEDIRTGFFAKRLNITTFEAIEEEDIENILEKPPGKVFIINKGILNTSIVNEQLEPLGLDVDDMFESSNAEMRARAFALSLAASIEEQGVFDMVIHIREGNITVQPKTAVVYIATTTPRQLYKQGKGIVVKEVNQRFDLIKEQVRS